MRRKPRHWAVIPGLVLATLAALGATGTAVIKLASFLSVPERVEATEKKLVEHDKVLDKLSVIEQQNSQLIQALSKDKTPEVSEVSDDGEVKEMQWVDKQGVKHHLCCSGVECWSWSTQTKCER